MPLYSRRFGWCIDKESICFSPGIVPAIGFLLRILTGEGDGVIIQFPVYYPFFNKIEANGRKVVDNALTYDDYRYSVNFDDLEEKAADPRNKLMILCSPHNPVGRVWTEEELNKTVEICRRYDVTIISDEIHCDLTRKGITHTPLERVCPDYKDRIITCLAPSKTFNLAGLQLSSIINDPAIRALWKREVSDKSGLGSPNPFGLDAATAAYSEGEDWLDQLREYLDSNIVFLEEFISRRLPKARVIKTEGTYLVWVDFKAYGLSHENLEKIVLEKAKVALDEGYFFGEEGRGFERFNVACPRSTLEQALERIAEVFPH